MCCHALVSDAALARDLTSIKWSGYNVSPSVFVCRVRAWRATWTFLIRRDGHLRDLDESMEV